MSVLNFSSETITFPFVENNHLKTTLVLANDSSTHVYFKFRSSKPKSYLVKPPQGYIKPHSSVSIIFTLQKNDITQAMGHKFLLLYLASDTPRTQNYEQMFVGDYDTKKFPIKITGIQLTNPIINEAVVEAGEQIFNSVQQSGVSKDFSPIQLVNSRSRTMGQERVNRIEREIGHNQKLHQAQAGKEDRKGKASSSGVSTTTLLASLILGLIIGYFLIPLLH